MTSTQKMIEPAPFQIEDMEHLADRTWSANWSEMGCYKTSTVCWLLPQWAERLKAETPQVLIITTRSGKGTFFKHGPQLLPDYELLNVTSKNCAIVMGNHEFAIGGVPAPNGHPRIFVAHYNVFTKRKKKKKEVEEEAGPASVDDMLKDILDDLGGKNIQQTPMLEQLQKVKWDIIILDEAHRIKERKTGWTKEVKKLKGQIKHVMTGTGFINDPSEVWSLLHFINKKEYGSYWRFREEYCAEDIVNGYRKITGIKRDKVDEFRELMRSIGPRRTKHEVFKNLPEPIFTPIEVELNAEQRRVYDGLRDELYALDQAGTPIYAPNVLSALQRLRQVCVATPRVLDEYYDPKKERRVQVIDLIEPSSKLDALMEILEGLEWDDERRDQVVVFSNFKDPIRLAIERFKEKRDINGRLIRKEIPYIEMKAGDNDRQRYEKWAIEFPKQNHQVFICTLQLGSESISLTSASTCIFLDRSWSPKDNEQGVSRVWRPGQESVANIIHINAKDTVDDRIMKANTRKVGWFKEIFG